MPKDFIYCDQNKDQDQDQNDNHNNEPNNDHTYGNGERVEKGK